MQLDLRKTAIMGILNVTPDSFSDGGKFFSVTTAVEQARSMIAAGADMIDIGGESTRPGASLVEEDEECRRVIPVIEALVKEVRVPISIDTYKPEVARRALRAGARILNDITGLANPEMRRVAREFLCPVVLMHMQGSPQTMQVDPVYEDVVTDIKRFFEKQITIANAEGIRDLILDPGIGFGKTLEHNLMILRRLGEFRELGYPVLVEPSRKGFIGKITGLPVEERVEGTIAAAIVARMRGAAIVRVHDVEACRRALQITDAILNV